jgi:hypothetical protein
MSRATYNGSFSSIRRSFIRPPFPARDCWYQALQVTVAASGTYTFISNSSLDMYGYFYRHPFDQTNPLRNSVTSDDDGAGNGQFLIAVNLARGSTYVLVVTTFHSNVTAIFSIEASGPSSIHLAAFTLLSRRPIMTESE